MRTCFGSPYVDATDLPRDCCEQTSHHLGKPRVPQKRDNTSEDVRQPAAASVLQNQTSKEKNVQGILFLGLNERGVTNCVMNCWYL